MQLSAVFFTAGQPFVADGAAKTRRQQPCCSRRSTRRSVVSAVLTNSPSEPTRTLLETLELIPHALVGTDSERKPMPAPDLLFRACEVLDVPPWEVLLVDSSDAGRQAAASAGCLFCRHRHVRSVHDRPTGRGARDRGRSGAVALGRVLHVSSVMGRWRGGKAATKLLTPTFTVSPTSAGMCTPITQRTGLPERSRRFTALEVP